MRYGPDGEIVIDVNQPEIYETDEVPDGTSIEGTREHAQENNKTAVIALFAVIGLLFLAFK